MMQNGRITWSPRMQTSNHGLDTEDGFVEPVFKTDDRIRRTTRMNQDASRLEDRFRGY